MSDVNKTLSSGGQSYCQKLERNVVDFGTTAKSKVNFYLEFLDGRQPLYIAIVILIRLLSKRLVHLYLGFILQLCLAAAVFNYTYSWQRSDYIEHCRIK